VKSTKTVLSSLAEWLDLSLLSKDRYPNLLKVAEEYAFPLPINISILVDILDDD
jgi:hypothetical protein